MSLLIHRDHGRKLHPVRTFAVAVVASVVLAVLAALAPVGIAHAAYSPELGILLTHHGVVVASTLPHCANEDGSGGPTPCTWNVGRRIDGNGRGLAYYISRPTGRSHYVWARSPLRGHHARHWLTKAQAQVWPGSVRCWLRIGPTSVVGCPNGHHFTS